MVRTKVAIVMLPILKKALPPIFLFFRMLFSHNAEETIIAPTKMPTIESSQPRDLVTPTPTIVAAVQRGQWAITFGIITIILNKGISSNLNILYVRLSLLIFFSYL